MGLYNNNYDTGELYMKYLKKDWVGTEQKRIPQPAPESGSPGHYFSPSETPTDNRYPDDWQPRANIKKHLVLEIQTLKWKMWSNNFHPSLLLMTN